MKTQYFSRVSIVKSAAATLTIPFEMLPISEGETQLQPIEVEDIARLCVRVNGVGATGIGKQFGTEGDTRYELDGSKLKVYLSPVDRLGEMTVVVDGNYGEIKLHAVIFVDVKNDAESEVEVSPYIFSAIAAGGTTIHASGVLFEDGLNAEEKVAEIKDEVQPTIEAVGVSPRLYYDVTTIRGSLIWSGKSWKSIDGVFESPLSSASEYKTGYINTLIEGQRKYGFVFRNGTAVIKSKYGVISKMSFWIEPSYAGAHVELKVNDGETQHITELTYLEIENSNPEIRLSVNDVYTNVAIDKAMVVTNNIAQLDVTKMEQYILTLTGGKFHHGEEELTFAQVKAAVLDTSKFVYLQFANAFHLPCFVVDAEGRQSVEFTSSFVIGGEAHIERVIINEQEQINVDNVQLLRINEDGGVSFGDDCAAEAEGAFAHGVGTRATGDYSHAEGWGTIALFDGQHAQGRYNNADDFAEEDGTFMHGCGTGEDDRKNAFAIAEDGKVYVIGLGGYDGTNHTEALSLQEIFGASIIQTATNKRVNNYDVPNLTAEQVTQAYNAVVAGKSVTITDATGNYHLGVTQADVLNGDIAISLIYLNVMLLTYEVSGSTVDVQFKNL